MPFTIVRNDITKMAVDVIVNTANPEIGYGRGTDAAIYGAAGYEKLLEARSEIGVIAPGEAYITDGFGIRAKKIIHTVGPVWEGGEGQEINVLRKCYINSLRLAADNNLASIAFPLISTGTYNFPRELAVSTALEVFSQFLLDYEMDIFLVVYDRKSLSVSEKFFADIESYIDDNYVANNYADTNYAAKSSYMGMSDNLPMYSSPAVSNAKPSRSFENMSGLFSLKRSKSVEEQECDIELSAAPQFEAPKRSLDDILRTPQMPFMDMVYSFADERNMTDLEVRKRANIDKKTFSKLKCGNTKAPSKPTALAIAIALELNLDETRDLLARAGLALSPCNRFDLIVQYFIERQIYDIYAINVALFEHGEHLLGSPAID